MKNFDFNASVSTFNAEIPAVEAEKLVVTLPESSGENPFSGKTFTENLGDSGDASRKTKTWTFTDSQATEVTTYLKDNSTGTDVYAYSYDATNKLLFLSLKSFGEEEDGESYTCSTVSEYEELLKEWSVDEEFELSDEELLNELASKTNQFATMVVYKYKISESSNTLTPYFYGTLPTAVNFSSSDNTIALKKGEGLWLHLGQSDRNDGYHCLAPNYENGNFSGIVTLNDDFIGVLAGTYTTSGTGTSGCTITLTFTELPDSVTKFATGTEHTLTN